MFHQRKKWCACLILSAIFVPMPGFSKSCPPETLMNPTADIRPHIKQNIDRLKDYSLTSVVHTTDSLSMPMGRGLYLPNLPKPFPAGRYQVLFKKNDDVKAILVQTESKVGHINTITPGVTDVGGYVKLFNSTDTEGPGGIQLAQDEIDYLLAMIYSKFCDSIDDSTAARLNKLKDMILAIRFSGAPGITEFHNRLLEKVKQHR